MNRKKTLIWLACILGSYAIVIAIAVLISRIK